MRVWTPESISAFNKERDEELNKDKVAPWDTLSEKAKLGVLSKLEKAVIEKEFSRLTNMSWELGRHPNGVFRAPASGTLILPKTMHSSAGEDKIRFRQGDDLNSIVNAHYDERVDPATYPGLNYVSNDGVIVNRKEYLGPNPRVAGYRFTLSKAEIEWWEPYLQDPWIGNTRWHVDAEFDETVRWWFVADRSIY